MLARFFIGLPFIAAALFLSSCASVETTTGETGDSSPPSPIDQPEKLLTAGDIYYTDDDHAPFYLYPDFSEATVPYGMLRKDTAMLLRAYSDRTARIKLPDGTVAYVDLARLDRKEVLTLRTPVREPRTPEEEIAEVEELLEEIPAAPPAPPAEKLSPWEKLRARLGGNKRQPAPVAAQLPTQPEPLPQAKPKPTPEPRPKPEPRPEPRPQPKPQPRPEPKPQPDPEPEPRPQPEAEPGPKLKLNFKPDFKPGPSRGSGNFPSPPPAPPEFNIPPPPIPGAPSGGSSSKPPIAIPAPSPPQQAPQRKPGLIEGSLDDLEIQQIR